MAWTARLTDDPGGTAAWLFSLADVAALPDPTPRDRQDVGWRQGADAQHFLQRRAALRGLVARRCGVRPTQVEIGYDAAGRPSILRPAVALCCSVSARRDLAALALSPYPVGVDLEPVEAGAIPWAVFTPGEAAAIRARAPAQQPVEALRLWTMKEAFLKARGTGLLSDPAAIEVTDTGLRAEGTAMAVDPTASWKITLHGSLVVAACIALAAPVHARVGNKAV